MLVAGSAIALAGLFLPGINTTVCATELQATDGALGDSFGSSVSVWGNRALIGAERNNGSQGAVYLFSNLSTTAIQGPKQAASDPASQDFFGNAVSLYSTIALVGAVGKNGSTGAAYFFADVSTPTTPVKLTAPDPAAGDSFGASVSLVGTIGLVGASSDDLVSSNEGSAYLFRDLAGAPESSIKLTATDAATNDGFGVSVSLSGSRGLVGASGKNSGQGAAYLFSNLNTGTITQIKIVASDPANGDQFGFSVSLSGNSALVGARQKAADVGATVGAAYFFADATDPMSEVKLLAFDRAAGDRFGTSVSLASSGALVGAPGDDNGLGAAYLFPDPITDAVQVRLVASNRSQLANFGGSVSVNGDFYVIGASFANGPTLFTGKAYTGSVSSVTTLDAGSSDRTIDGVSFVSRTNWIIGQNTDGNQVTLQQGNSADITAPGKAVYVGQNTGSDNNALVLAGAVTATTVNVSALGGGGVNNVLQITKTGTLTATTITVNGGGSLLLSGPGNQDRISNTAAITLAGGVIQKGSGASEGTNNSVGLGALTLTTAGSQIDFTGTSGTLTFQSLTPGANVLSIVNYIGNGSPGGFDQLVFAQDQVSQLANFDFGFGPGVNVGQAVVGTGFFEVYSLVPVPEPSTWLSGGLLAAILGIKLAHRLRRGNPS